MSPEHLHFPRAALAKSIADEVMLRSPWSFSANGVFLTAPKGTGKTTFLREDLAPLLSKEAFVIYADLLAEPDRGPTAAVKDAVQRSNLAAKSFANGAITRAELNRAGFAKGASEDPLTDEHQLPVALNSIQTLVQTPVVLIIDEAQHALTHPDGMDLMRSLKSARDQINTRGEANLRILMAGSHKDKLMHLVREVASPFYGSAAAVLPPLGRDYLEYVAEQIKASTNIDFVDINTLEQAFELTDHKPEALANIIGMALNPLLKKDHSFSTMVIHGAQNLWICARAIHSDTLDDLPALDRAIMERIGSTAGRFAVSGKESLAAYSMAVGETVSAQRVQKALHRLQSSDPPLLWKAGTAEYVIEDPDLRDWIRIGQDFTKGGGAQDVNDHIDD